MMAFKPQLTVVIRLLALLSLSILPSDLGAASIRIKNTLGEPFTLWFYVQVRQDWARPELFLMRYGTAVIELASPGKYYLVVRDQAYRDEHIGWLDLHALCEKHPNAEILLDALYETQSRDITVWNYRFEERTKELTYQICKPVWETRTRVFTDPRTGQEIVVNEKHMVMVPESRTHTTTYTVRVPYAETRTISERVRRAVLTIKIDGELRSLELFKSAPQPE